MVMSIPLSLDRVDVPIFAHLATMNWFTDPNLSLKSIKIWDIRPNVPSEIDTVDRRILAELQRDGTLSVDQLSERVNLSRNACWRRVKRLEEDGVITGRVALVDADRLGLGLSVFILVRTSNHDPDWLKRFRDATTGFPEITGVYRMSGDLDYVLRARVADVKAYDRLYQRLIAKVPLSDVSASFVMEEIKETTVIPVEIR
jgi:Lrp/AsnC family transcriptional regulator